MEESSSMRQLSLLGPSEESRIKDVRADLKQMHCCQWGNIHPSIRGLDQGRLGLFFMLHIGRPVLFHARSSQFEHSPQKI